MQTNPELTNLANMSDYRDPYENAIVEQRLRVERLVATLMHLNRICRSENETRKDR